MFGARSGLPRGSNAGRRAADNEPAREAFMLQGGRRQTVEELAREAAGAEDLQEHYRQLLLQPSEPEQQQPSLPTYGQVRPAEGTLRQLADVGAAELAPSASPPLEGEAVAGPPPAPRRKQFDLRLSSIKDPSIRSIFDPTQTTGAGSLETMYNWSEEQLQALVDQMRPEHMAVLSRKRVVAAQERQAKRLSWRNLSYRKDGIDVLKNCDGFIEPGELVCVSGGPDAGVSALMALLAGEISSDRSIWDRLKHPGARKTSSTSIGFAPPKDELERQMRVDSEKRAKQQHHSHPTDTFVHGEVLYDGIPRTQNFVQQVGFAPKNDNHLPYLTVYETLYFSARLRLPAALPDKIVHLRVMMVLKLLGLTHVRDTVVGDAMIRGISGGEKRRVGMGVEMCAGHSCILADLPTNGLDSASALGLLQAMAYSCVGGFSLLFSIVQASQAILDLVDRIVLLCKGSIIYTGPPNQAEFYLSSLGFRRPRGKALPQFLEECSANPEKFWQPFLHMRIDDVMLSAGKSEFQKEEDLEAQKRPALLGAAMFQQGTFSPSPRPGNESDAADKKNPPPSVVYDPRSSLTPREQAYNLLHSAWEGSAAHEELTSMLDACRQQPHLSLQQHHNKLLLFKGKKEKLARKQSKIERKQKQKEAQEAQAAKQQQQLLELTGVAPKSSPVPAGPSSMPPAVRPSASPPVVIDMSPVSNAPMGSFESEPSASRVVFHMEADEAGDEEGDYGERWPSASAEPSADAECTIPSPPVGHEKKRGWLAHRWYKLYNSSPWQQFQCNWTRQVRATYRNYGLWRDIWILAVVIGILIGLLFYQLGVDDDGVQERVALFFFILSYIAFNAVQLVPVLAQQRPVYYTNIHAGYNHPFFYFITLQLVQLPIIAIESLLLLTPLYGISDLSGGVWREEFWVMYLIVLMNSHIARTWLLCLYVASPNEVVADVLNQVTSILFSKLCGFFIPAASIVAGWHWVFTISWFSYALRALSNNDLVRNGGVRTACVPSPSDACRFETGAQGLDLLYEMDTSVSVWSDVLALLYFTLAFNFAALVLLCYVDWSALDKFEAADFGSAQLQIQDAQAHQDARASERGLITLDELRKKSLVRHQSYATLTLSGGGGKPPLLTPRSRAGSRLELPPSGAPVPTGAAATAADSASKPRSFLDRVLQRFDSSSALRPKHSHIVVPIVTNLGSEAAASRPNSAQPTLGDGAGNAAVAAAASREKQLRNRAVSAGGAPSYFTGGADPDDDLTLTRTHRAHYHHEIHEVDVAALLQEGGVIQPVDEEIVDEAQEEKKAAEQQPAQADQKATAAAVVFQSPRSSMGRQASLPRLRRSASSHMGAGGSVPSTGAVLEWSDLTYSVPVRDDKTGKTVQKVLLDHCYGHVEPGQMVALMGASGAGKSTLLDVLANKKTGGEVRGSILLDGKPRDERFAHVTGYVEQWDSHSPYATVREALEFSGRLRLATAVSDEELARRVDSILSLLGLTHLQHDLIGGQEGVPGVSQEARKKVTIGVELITQPKLLFLDEPTTGLDAAGAFAVCQAMKNLSQHMAVICTIHQPSSEIIGMFERILLMQPGGKVCYCGPVSSIPAYFAEHGLGRCAKDRNVSDFALESIRTVTNANLQKFGHGGGDGASAPSGQADLRKEKEEIKMKANDMENGAAKRPNEDTAEPIITARDATKDEEQPDNHAVPMRSGQEQAGLLHSSPAAGSKALKPSGSFPPSASEPDTSHPRDLSKEFLASKEGQCVMADLKAGVYNTLQQGAAGSGEKQQGQAIATAEAAAPSKGAGKDALIASIPPPRPLRPFHVQLWCLLQRDSWSIWRNRHELAVRFGLSVFIGFVTGTVFFQLGASQSDAEQRVSAIFVVLLFLMFTSNAFLPDMFFARPMYFRENTAGAYTPGPFFVAKLIAQLPYILLEVFPLAIMVHFISDLSGYNHHAALGWMFFCFVLVRYASLTVTLFIGALFAEPNNANTLHATYLNLLFAFTGFLIKGTAIPIGWEWFYDLNYLRWALDFLSVSELRHRNDLVCAADDYVLQDPASFAGRCPSTTYTTVGASPALLPAGATGYNSDTILKCPYACGQDLLHNYGIEYSDGDMAMQLGLVAVFGAAFAIAGFIALKYINHIQR